MNFKVIIRNVSVVTTFRYDFDLGMASVQEINMSKSRIMMLFA